MDDLNRDVIMSGKDSLKLAGDFRSAGQHADSTAVAKSVLAALGQ